MENFYAENFFEKLKYKGHFSDNQMCVHQDASNNKDKSKRAERSKLDRVCLLYEIHPNYRAFNYHNFRVIQFLWASYPITKFEFSPTPPFEHSYYTIGTIASISRCIFKGLLVTYVPLFSQPNSHIITEHYIYINYCIVLL